MYSPHHIAWQTTYKCNLSCIHCYAAGVSKNLLSTTEAKRIILEALEIGVKAFVFTGGEPLLRDDIMDLIIYVSDLGLKPILATNGTLLDENRIRILKEFKASVAINLPAINEEIHEKFTGVKSSLRLKLNTINKCREYGLECSIGIAITKLNMVDIDSIIQHVENMEIDILATIPCGRASPDIIPSGFEYYSLLKHLHDKWKAYPMNMYGKARIYVYEPIYNALLAISSYMESLSRLCSIGETLHVMEDGSIKTCIYLPYVLGNVRKTSLANIWRKLVYDKLIGRLRDPKELKGYCNVCKLRNVCGGCRARAYHMVGDLFASDPICSLPISTNGNISI